MKFSCDKYVLQQAAASAARAAAAKSPIPTLEGLLIEAGASVRITGYDLKKAIYTTIDADIPEPGSVLIGARLFCEMLRRMPDGIVTVEAENGTVSVKCGKAAFNLVGLSADDYPDLPTVEAENGVSLPQDLLKKMINECSFAVSTNESRPVYMGTLFEIENNVLTMVSVDGYRLALRRGLQLHRARHGAERSGAPVRRQRRARRPVRRQQAHFLHRWQYGHFVPPAGRRLPQL